MFDSIGMWEILVLLIAALFILGPERLPDAMAWVGRSVRKVREFATGARDQLRDEMGPEFDEFRKPIEDLRSLRNFDPKRAVTQHLFDGDEDPLGLNDDGSARGAGAGGAGTGSGGAGSNGATRGTAAAGGRVQDPLIAGEKPPVDPDAT
ncbi:Sec-independent protein translocase protein TatB [Haloechinothrix halophila]|uniref:Sec-independent protein translocase protein TatB n=1 Tax=Haloechinothrix halophila TaxID=1069073 RepID=UPI0003FDE60C|nr:Sec-independent protein translocase protein TatB [Haloechinothrix halophila]